ncbi:MULTISPECIES: hypothetical protein [unclassified Streptomyces]|uniref:hypothetical protein n=1 Tax=unclassified Streptomyces TaxID=2593676 RepID=UPI0036FA5144
MDTDPAPTDAPTAENPGCFIGCAVAMLLLTVLIALGAWALEEFEKGLDGDGQLERTGASGSVVDPLGPGATARYEDGLEITVSPPRREADGTYDLTVTYENDTDEEVSLGGETLGDAVGAALTVREGEPLDDHAVGHYLTWMNWRECAFALTPPLGEDETREVTVRVRPDKRGTPVTVEVIPPDDGYRETAYFQVTLD